MTEISYFTNDGLEKIKAELSDLKTKGRAFIAAAIQEAREKGDLSENAEYDAAKEAQGLHELKIAKLETLIASARVLDENQLDLSFAQPLTTVKIKNLTNKIEMSYTLVAEKEADLKLKKISVTSPIGKGLLGKRIGDVAEIQTPSGLIKFEVMGISL